MEFLDEELKLNLKRASVWADLYVAGRTLFQIAEMFIVSVTEVRRTLWDAGFIFHASIQSKKAIWTAGFPALKMHIPTMH